ncbi:MAG TPA: ATP-binding cassette domain-containing protein, partial [Actinomycetota bacterium]
MEAIASSDGASARHGAARVRFEAVSKRFGEVQVLSEFSLDVPPGAFLVVLGPSGCGKTTALRVVA